MSSPRSPLLERAGVTFFRRRRLAALPAATDPVHVLNQEERRALRRIQRNAVLRAALVGAISAGIIGTINVLFLDPDRELQYWLTLGIVGSALAACEITFLYWDALRSTHALSRAAGLEIFGDEKEEREQVASALVRAALELPNPPYPVFGVDPRRELSRARVVLVTIFYKAKVGLTNFLFRALLRRILGRAAARGLLSYAAVPVTAAWNALVAHKVLREARIRVLGPSAALELCGFIFAAAGELGADGREVAVRAVGSSIVRTRDMHPNLHHLLVHVSRELGEVEGDVDDPIVFLDKLARLPHGEQVTALRILNVASIIDGRLTKAETALVREALARTGHSPTDRHVRRLRRAFLGGDRITREMVLKIAE